MTVAGISWEDIEVLLIGVMPCALVLLSFRGGFCCSPSLLVCLSGEEKESCPTTRLWTTIGMGDGGWIVLGIMTVGVRLLCSNRSCPFCLVIFSTFPLVARGSSSTGSKILELLPWGLLWSMLSSWSEPSRLAGGDPLGSGGGSWSWCWFLC